MKYCTNCGAQLEESVNFCPACGTNQDARTIKRVSSRTPGIIITLSVFTLLGSTFGMIRGVFYQTFATLFDASAGLYHSEYQRGYILVLLNLGTMIAAILMLNLKRTGYYLYLLFQSGYIVFTAYIIFIYSSYNKDAFLISDGVNPLILLMGSFFLLPSTILLILHLAFARKHFTS